MGYKYLPSTKPELKKAGLDPNLLVSKNAAKKFNISIGSTPVAQKYFNDAHAFYELYQVVDPNDLGLVKMREAYKKVKIIKYIAKQKKVLKAPFFIPLCFFGAQF